MRSEAKKKVHGPLPTTSVPWIFQSADFPICSEATVPSDEGFRFLNDLATSGPTNNFTDADAVATRLFSGAFLTSSVIRCLSFSCSNRASAASLDNPADRSLSSAIFATCWRFSFACLSANHCPVTYVPKPPANANANDATVKICQNVNHPDKDILFKTMAPGGARWCESCRFSLLFIVIHGLSWLEQMPC